MTNKQQSGRLGGLATVRKHGREHMQEIGRRGAHAFWSRYTLRPIGTNDFAIVRRDNGQPINKTINGTHILKGA